MKRKHKDDEDMVVKKLVLVPPDKVIPEYRLKHKAYRPPFQPDRNQLAVLDEKMANVLEDKNISLDTRVNDYQEILDRFLTFFKKAKGKFPVQTPTPVPTAPPVPTPPPPPLLRRETIEEKEKEEEEREARRVMRQRKDDLQFFGLEREPPAVVNRAEQLLNRLTQAGLTWDKQGEVRYPDGEVDEDANIADLVHDVVKYQKSKKKQNMPAGSTSFYNFLQDIHVPHMVLGSQAKRDWFTQQKIARRTHRQAQDIASQAINAGEAEFREEEEGEEEEEEEGAKEWGTANPLLNVNREGFNKQVAETLKFK